MQSSDTVEMPNGNKVSIATHAANASSLRPETDFFSNWRACCALMLRLNSEQILGRPAHRRRPASTAMMMLAEIDDFAPIQVEELGELGRFCYSIPNRPNSSATSGRIAAAAERSESASAASPRLRLAMPRP